LSFCSGYSLEAPFSGHLFNLFEGKEIMLNLICSTNTTVICDAGNQPSNPNWPNKQGNGNSSGPGRGNNPPKNK
jgi:hypothetical protein